MGRHQEAMAMPDTFGTFDIPPLSDVALTATYVAVANLRPGDWGIARYWTVAQDEAAEFEEHSAATDRAATE
jgi:hypothetical protein